MLTLHCPNCGYNLTGLPENRCPECGGKFDPARLALRSMCRVRPLGPRGAVWRILLLPAAFWALYALAVGPGPDSMACLLFPFGLFQGVGGIIIACALAERVANGRAMSKHRLVNDDSDQRYMILWTMFLYVLQLMSGIGGLVTLLMLAWQL
jgi:hypothetical protein